VHATVSTLTISAPLAALRALGIDGDEVVRLANLPREVLSDPHARLPVEMILRLWEAAVRVSGDPSIGLRVGEQVHSGAFGSFEYLLRNSETVQKLLVRAAEFMRLIDDSCLLEVSEHEGTATLRVTRTDGYFHPQAEVECFFAACRALQQREWPGAAISAVTFTERCPTEVATYVRYFGCGVRFEREHNQIQFPASLLGDAPHHADPNLGLVLEEYARHLLTKLPEGAPLVNAMRRLLLEQLGHGPPSLALVARTLHLSERTLRRRLDAEGTSYQIVLDELRQSLAYQYVGKSRAGFEDIAARLGYSDAGTFLRAFRRWSGTTPAQFRERART
jgi:AraC-like DNA-binding protein